MNPNELKYAVSHEWVRQDGGIAVVGITDFAVAALTDLVFLELPAVGAEAVAGESLGEVESVKAVSEILAPVSGRIIETNSGIVDDLDCLKADPFGEGWLVKIEMSDPGELDSLLDRAAYEKQCSEGEH